MGAYSSQFIWNVSSNLSVCPNCFSDVVKVRQLRGVEEGKWEEGDMVECQCCSHEGVIELYPSASNPKESIARVEWDALPEIPGQA